MSTSVERKLDRLISLLESKMEHESDDKCCSCHNCDVQTSFSMTAVRANEAASQASIVANQNFIAQQQASQQAMLREMFPSLTKTTSTVPLT